MAVNCFNNFFLKMIFANIVFIFCSLQHQPEFGGISWSADRGGRIDRADRNDHFRSDRMGRPGVGRMDHANRAENKRINMNVHVDDRPGRPDRSSRDQGDRRSSGAEATRRIQGNQRQAHAYGGNSAGDVGRGKRDRSSLGAAHGSEKNSGHMRRSNEYPESSRQVLFSPLLCYSSCH